MSVVLFRGANPSSQGSINQIMTEKVSKDQYGRKTWDVDAFAEEANKKNKKAEPVVSTENQLKDTLSSSHLSHRNKLIEQSLLAVKTYNIINPLHASGGSYGKNKRFGFFCPICNLSFRDNLSLIDHFNSPQHVANATKLSKSTSNEEGEPLEGGISRASLQDVIKTMESLVSKLIREKSNTKEQVSFKERVEKRRLFEEQKREKRQQKRAKKNPKSEDTEEESELQRALGFKGFSSTKK